MAASTPNHSQSVRFYEANEISDEKLGYVTVVGRRGDQWVLIRKNGAESYEFPGGKREAGESIEDTLIREVREEIGANISRAIPLAVYQFTAPIEEKYGKLFYCEFEDSTEDPDETEIAEVKLISDTKGEEILAPHLGLLNYTRGHRRFKNKWFYLDTRRSFGRADSITVGEMTKEIRRNIADPMDITNTLVGFFEEYLAGKVKGPIQLDLNPTSRCTDNCVFCFNKEDRTGDRDELDVDQAIATIDFLCENTNLMHVKSSGFGDPLRHPHLWDIFKHCKQKGLVVSLNTNGNGLSKYVDEAMKLTDSIRFSLDAWGEDQFREIHGVNDFVERKQAIEELAKRRALHRPDLIMGIHYVVMPSNLSGVEEMIKWAIDNGIDYIDITLDKFSWGYINKWDEKAVAEAIAKIKELSKYISPTFNVILPAEVTTSDQKLADFREERLNGSTCWQIELRHYITPSGEYGACNAFDSQPIAKRVFGNIYDDQMSSTLSSMSDGSPLASKDADCIGCVIPHGAFNDLCDFVYENTSSK